MVLEGAARRGVDSGTTDGVTVVHAAGSGDDALLDVAARHRRAGDTGVGGPRPVPTGGGPGGIRGAARLAAGPAGPVRPASGPITPAGVTGTRASASRSRICSDRAVVERRSSRRNRSSRRGAGRLLDAGRHKTIATAACRRVPADLRDRVRVRRRRPPVRVDDRGPQRGGPRTRSSLRPPRSRPSTRRRARRATGRARRRSPDVPSVSARSRRPGTTDPTATCSRPTSPRSSSPHWTPRPPGSSSSRGRPTRGLRRVERD